MHLKKILIMTGLVLIIASGKAYSQYYSSAVGARLGNASGLTGKVLMGKRTYLEGMFTVRNDGFNVTALVEFAQTMADTPRLGWYYGAGANIGYWDDSENNSELNVGVDGILGMEYTFEDVPINVSIDWKPYFILITDPRFEFDEFALSVRYVIGSR
jgi:hypothetical protein